MSINLPDQALTEVVKYLGETWGNLVNPTAEAIGRFFGDLFEIVGLPLHHAKNKLGSLCCS